MRHESKESEQVLMAELCEHEKETWIQLTQTLMTSQVSVCKEESAGCSSSSSNSCSNNNGGSGGGNINSSGYLGRRKLY